MSYYEHDYETGTEFETRWMDDAACQGMGDYLFFPEGGPGVDGRNHKKELTEMAKKLCASCPVRQICLDAALERDEREGIWGGLTGLQRARITNARRQAAKLENAPQWAAQPALAFF